ncbi:MAG: hypothetical protein HQL26_01025 [Candidatus Omnitrophica bacterium]|nr:hypothetical protein [Candidatus Omnitrophota bacterium]
MPSQKQKNGSGKITIIEANSQQSFEFKIFHSLPVIFSFETKYIGLNQATDYHFPGYLTAAGFDIETTVPVFNSDKTFLQLGANPSFYSDTWSFTTDSFRLPLRAILIDRPNTTLFLVSGIAFYPDFEEKIYPLVGFIYKPNEKWVFNITSENPNIIYSLNKKNELFIEANAYLDEEFNTTKDSVKNTVLEFREISLGGGLRHKFNSCATTTFSVGQVINRVIKYKNSPDVIRINNGLYVEMKFNIKI